MQIALSFSLPPSIALPSPHSTVTFLAEEASPKDTFILVLSKGSENQLHLGSVK